MNVRRSGVSTCRSLAITLLVILLAPLCTQQALAQEFPVIDQFIGAWEGRGTLFGADAEFSMEWEWVLDQQFVRLTFENRIQDADGTERILKAQAFYRLIEAGRFDGTWFDSRGIVLPLEGNAEQATLTTLWGTPETEQGRTVYHLLDESRLAVEDSVLQGDQWHTFGHAIYRRLAETP